MRSIMNKSGKGEGILYSILAVLVVGLLIALFGGGVSNKAIGGGSGKIEITGGTGGCPTDLAHTGTFKIQNNLNTSGIEYFNVTGYFYDAQGNFIKSATIGDSTDVSLTCGKDYELKIISTDGAGGDSSQFVNSGNLLDSVKFTANGKEAVYTLYVAQRGVPEVRSKDLVNDEFMYDTGDADSKDYETTDGVVFTSITNNATATAVGTSGEFHVMQYLRANAVDNKFNDRGILVLIDAPTSDWDKPTLKVDGSVYNDASASLTESERIAYNDYEYVYLIPSEKLVLNNNEIKLDMQIFALNGVDPATNISMDYAVRGQFASTLDASKLLVGAVKDDSSRTQVLTLHNTKYWIS